jgi:predicted nucleic acid-binding protein
MAACLVDTNVLSELVRRRPDPHALAWLDRQAGIALSVVSIEELVFGVQRTKGARRDKLKAWLDALVAGAERVYDVTSAVARASGELRAAREASGRPVAQADMLIAATARVHGLTLATRNVRDFKSCGVVLVDPFSGADVP